MTDLAAARSFLFVPADRPERIAKARASGADAVVLDLEDAVAPAAKASARAAFPQHLDPARPLVLRVNASGTPDHEADLALAAHPGIAAVMLPKAEAAADLARLAAPSIPMIETAKGMANLPGIASAPGVLRLAFGTLDLMADLGIPADSPALDVFRAQMALASRVAGIAPPIDGVTPTFGDPGAVEADTRHALRFGFTARLLIHPRQVEPVHQAMHPTDEELAWAREVLALGVEGVATHKGTMIDKPVVERARRLLARA